MNDLEVPIGRPLTLGAATAVDMIPEPVTVPHDFSLKEAVLLLVDRHISAAPVVDDDGRVVGVISRSDIVERDREAVTYARQVPEYFTRADLYRATGEEIPASFGVEQVDRTRVRDLMTPVVFSVRPEASAEEVVRQIVNINVHRLFVVEREGTLIGVISLKDIVRKLQPCPPGRIQGAEAIRDSPQPAAGPDGKDPQTPGQRLEAWSAVGRSAARGGPPGTRT